MSFCAWRQAATSRLNIQMYNFKVQVRVFVV